MHLEWLQRLRTVLPGIRSWLVGRGGACPLALVALAVALAAAALSCSKLHRYNHAWRQQYSAAGA